MNGPIKFALAQIEVIPGRPDLNFARIKEEIEKAKERSVDVIAFPEMAVPGYMIGDEWENDNLIEDLLRYNLKIFDLTEGITVIWGNVWACFIEKGFDGRTRKYNAVYIAQNKKWLRNDYFCGYSIKTLLPEYREFDDPRHFYSMVSLARENQIPLQFLLKPFPVNIRGQEVKIGLSLCEDMWHQDYGINPCKILADNGAEVIVNISCSPWTWRKNDKRHRVVADILKEGHVPFLYVNNVGIQNNGKDIFLFDGSSTAYNPDGSLLAKALPYTEQTIDVMVDGENRPMVEEPTPVNRDTNELYQGLIYGIRRFFNAIDKRDVLIGLSGGIDSAVVTCLLTTALGKEHVYAVNLPSQFNSSLTKNAARKLAENLGISYAIVPIQDSVDLTVDQIKTAVFEQLDETKKLTIPQVTPLDIENIQARDRGSRVLAGLASAMRAIFTNNGNKTETTIGYATLYGDIDGAIAPIGDIYKFEVYQLAEYINQISGWAVIPEEIIKVTPSAELSSEQDVTKGKGDPIKYPYHDKLFRAFVEFRFDPEKILELYDRNQLEEVLMIKKGTLAKYFATNQEFIDDLEKMWRLYKLSVFKRIQAPPVIAVSRRAFGFDLREAQLQSRPYYTMRYNELKAKLLNS